MSSRKVRDGEHQQLHAAARSGDLSAVQSILAANPLLLNSRDKHSRTPLHLAAWAGNDEVVSYLCKQKADIGAAAVDDMCSIHFAAQKGHLQVVRTLISSGVSLKATNRKGLTALHYAVQGSHTELAKYLVKKGASLAAKTKVGKTPLDLTSSDELRVVLVEYEQSLHKGVSNDKDNLETSSVEKAEMLDIEDKSLEHNEEHLESAKRKVVEDKAVDAHPELKKTRVALNHLLTSDDIEEEVE